VQLTYRSILSRALAAGLVAGVLLALYTVVVVGPTIDDAIALEEATAAAVAPAEGAGHDHGEEALFSRSVQVGGGMAATVIYAVVVSVIFGTVLASVRHRLPGWSELGRVLWLAAVTFGAVALIPGVKYPANPPAVGDPGTVNERTVQYLVLLASSIALAVLLTRLAGRLRSRIDGPTRVVAVAAATVVGYGLLVIAMPGSPDAIDPTVPAQLVWDFRVRSFGGLALLWAAIGIGLGWELERAVASEPVTAEPALARA
jgi:predicted cobalt transporter CbtA